MRPDAPRPGADVVRLRTEASAASGVAWLLALADPLKPPADNYCRHLETKEYVFFSGALPKLEEHESQYSFWTVPKGSRPETFLGYLMGESAEEFAERTAPLSQNLATRWASSADEVIGPSGDMKEWAFRGIIRRHFASGG